jgi:membrane-bound metal-dependent hydrolase YbcI (DUF457 family)
MDLFTHMLIGYMIAWVCAFTVTGYHDYLFLICSLMTMIPDFDMVLYAVPKRVRERVRGIRHRGVSHTLVFVVVCAAVVALIFVALGKVTFLPAFFVAILGGLSHVIIDATTSYGFPYLAPFSWKDRSLDLDGAVTWYMVPYSVISIISMWSMRSYALPFQTYKIVVWVVFLGIILHYMARLTVKLYTEKVLHRGEHVKVNPTPRLLSFYLMKYKKVHGVRMIEYEFTQLLRSRSQDKRLYIEVERLAKEDEVVKEPKDVYDALLASSAALGPKTYPDMSRVAAKPMASNKDQWKFFWFDWNDWNPMKGTKGQMVTILPDAKPIVENATEKISW